MCTEKEKDTTASIWLASLASTLDLFPGSLEAVTLWWRFLVREGVRRAAFQEMCWTKEPCTDPESCISKAHEEKTKLYSVHLHDVIFIWVSFVKMFLPSDWGFVNGLSGPQKQLSWWSAVELHCLGVIPGQIQISLYFPKNAVWQLWILWWSLNLQQHLMLAVLHSWWSNI